MTRPPMMIVDQRSAPAPEPAQAPHWSDHLEGVGVLVGVGLTWLAWHYWAHPWMDAHVNIPMLKAVGLIH